MKRLLTIAAILFCVNSYALEEQDPKIDSLRKVVAGQIGIEKYDPLIALMRELYGTDYEESLAAAREAYSIATEFGDSARIVESARMCGQLYNYLNRSSDALAILHSVASTAQRKFPDEYLKVLNNIAIAHTARAEYDKALSVHFLCLALGEERGDYISIGRSYQNIGHAYFRMRNFSEALANFKKALTTKQKSNDLGDIESLYNNIGFCLNQLAEHKEARDYFRKALSACGDDCRLVTKVSTLHGLAIASFSVGYIEEARANFQASLKLAREINDIRAEAENLLWVAKLAVMDGKHESAIRDLNSAESFALELEYTELLISIYKQLSEIYGATDDYKNYSKYLEKYVMLKDSIYDENVLNNLAKAKTDYEQRENLAIIKARELTIAQQHRFNMAVMVIAFLAGALVLVLFWNNNSIKKINVELSNARDLIYEQNKQLEMRNRELDKVVERKTDELKLVNLSLKEMNDELNSFIFRTSQDIRGPLATLKGMCYVALKDIKDNVSLEYMNRINSTTDNLQTILKRLLIINSINSTKANPTVIDLKGLVDKVISSQQLKGLPPNLLFRRKIEDNVVIHCDQDLLAIVLENSIESAVRLCSNPQGREHFVEVDVSSGRNNRVNIRIVNNGVVTSQYNSDELYEVFLDSMFGEPRDSGDEDLYFVKTAAKKIGARVEMKRTPEGFNELSVTL